MELWLKCVLLAAFAIYAVIFIALALTERKGKRWYD